MTRVRRLIAGARALLRSSRVDRELDEELQAYLEAAIEENVRAGMEPGEAVRNAHLQFGTALGVRERTRDVGWETRFENAWRDVRYAARRLRKSPAFSAVAAVTLALGIGVNTAIFSAVNAIMLRPLPVERPEELVLLAARHPGGMEPTFSYAAYRRILADGAHLVDPIAASTVRRDAITLDGAPEPADLEWVSGNYFATLAVPAAIGRTLLPADDPFPPGERVAVLSDAYWTRRFGRDSAVVGRTFRLKATTFTIVGVAPRDFWGESAGETADIWMPLSAQPGAPPWLWSGHSTTWLRLLARRRPGVGLEQARAGLEPVYERIRNEIASGTDSPEFRRSVLESRLVVSEGSRGASRVRDNFSKPLLVLMAIVGLVLLVVCANVASLMLARATARRREIAVSLALGAARWRVVRQGVAEAMVLAALGGLAGLLLAMWATSILEDLVSGAMPISLDLAPDARVLAFAALTSCATAVLFGLLPAVRATRLDPLEALRSGGGTYRLAARIPLGRTLVVTQMAVSLVLLVAAGLFVRSLLNLRTIDPGFDPDRLVTLRIAPAGHPGSAEAARGVYSRLLERAEGVPGVVGASASFSGLLSRDAWRNAIKIEGRAPQPGVTLRTFVNAVTPRYFDVVRIAMLRGRGFTDGDRADASKVAIVNETFARQFFGEPDAVRRRVGLCSSDPCDPSAAGLMEIVGVAEDAKYGDLREERRPMLYLPAAQWEGLPREVQVRTAGDLSAVAATLYRELASADRRLAIVAMIEARDRVEASMASEIMTAKLAAAFGLLALALASIGLYGLIAYVTTGRSGEIGIRMALGAGKGDIRRLVLGDTVRLVALGAAIGIPAALGGARLLSSLLYQVQPADAIALFVAITTLCCAAFAAAYLPARRAMAVDPSHALRAE
jgi:predicted permease